LDKQRIASCLCFSVWFLFALLYVELVLHNCVKTVPVLLGVHLLPDLRNQEDVQRHA